MTRLCFILRALTFVALASLTTGTARAQGADGSDEFRRALGHVEAGRYEEAAAEYHVAAELGHAGAMNALANAYRIGRGVAVDLEQAFVWQRRAAETGHLASMFNLAIAYALGDGVEPDTQSSLHWLRLAAEGGLSSAQHWLGMRHIRGEGVAVDFDEGMKWFQLAAYQGDVKGMTALGYHYSVDDGVPVDLELAYTWTSRAAEAGDVIAMSNVAFMFHTGRGVSQDDAQASYWWRRAAELGNEESALWLEEMRAQGRDHALTALPFNRLPPAELRSRAREALDARDFLRAYPAIHALLGQEVDDPMALVQLATIYFELDAPAAAIQTLQRARSQVSSPALARQLAVQKIQAHLALGDLGAAWANLGRLLDEHRLSGDSIIDQAVGLRWPVYAAFASQVAFERVARRRARVEAAGEQDPKLGLASFDALILEGRMSAADWRARFELAAAEHDLVEMAFAASQVGDKGDAQIIAWPNDLEAHVAAHAERVARNAASLEASIANVDALFDLIDALEQDPSDDAAWQLVQRTHAALGDDVLAANVLAQRWSLHVAADLAEGPSLALAARANHWPLLLAMSDQRVVTDDNDIEAHFHRMLAAAALGLDELAMDSLQSLGGTPYEGQARILVSLLGDGTPPTAAEFDDTERGLALVHHWMRVGGDDAVLRLGLVLALSRMEERAAAHEQYLTELVRDAAPLWRAPIDFITGSTAEPELLAAAGDDQHALALARFLIPFAAVLRGEASEDSMRALSAAGTDPQLPLLLRVAAARRSNTADPLPPLRTADRLHVHPRSNGDHWPLIWQFARGGRMLVIAGDCSLSNTPRGTVLRMEAVPSRRPLLRTEGGALGPVWELSGFDIGNRHEVRGEHAWSLEADHVLVLRDVTTHRQDVNGAGHVLISASSINDMHVTAKRFFIHECSSYHLRAVVSAQLHVDRFLSNVAAFALHDEAVAFADAAVFHRCQFSYAKPFTLPVGLRVHMRDCVFFEQMPIDLDLDDSVLAAQDCSFIGSQPLPGAARESMNVLQLGRADARVHKISDAAELRELLVGKAGSSSTLEPGDTIELAPGIYSLVDVFVPLSVPPGVTLSGPERPHSQEYGSDSTSSIPNSYAVELIVSPFGLRLGPRHANDPQTGAVLLQNILVRGTEHDPSYRERSFAPLVKVMPGIQAMLRHCVFRERRSLAPDGIADLHVSAGAAVFLSSSYPALTITEEGSRVSLALAFGGRAERWKRAQVPSAYPRHVMIAGAGDLYSQVVSGPGLIVSGRDVGLYAVATSRDHIRLQDGAATVRERARQDRNRAHLVDVLQHMRHQLDVALTQGPDLAARTELVRQVASGIGPIITAANVDPVEMSAMLHDSFLLPLLRERNSDFGPLYTTFFMTRAIPIDLVAPSRSKLTARERDIVASYARLTLATQRNGATRETAFGAAQEIFRLYPPGNELHSEALALLARGVSLDDIKTQLQVLVEEAAERNRNRVSYEEYRERVAAAEREYQAISAYLRKVADDNARANRDSRRVTYDPSWPSSSTNSHVESSARLASAIEASRQRAQQAALALSDRQKLRNFHAGYGYRHL